MSSAIKTHTHTQLKVENNTWAAAAVGLLPSDQVKLHTKEADEKKREKEKRLQSVFSGHVLYDIIWRRGDSCPYLASGLQVAKTLDNRIGVSDLEAFRRTKNGGHRSFVKGRSRGHQTNSNSTDTSLLSSKCFHRGPEGGGGCVQVSLQLKGAADERRVDLGRHFGASVK